MNSAGLTITERVERVASEAIRRRAYQKPHEFVAFLDLVDLRQPSAVLEIGSAEGGTFYALAQLAAPDALLASVDWAPDLDEPHISAATLRSYAQPEQTVAIIRGDSRLTETRDQAAAAAPDGYDLLFIDGDHTLPAVTRDHELYAPLVRAGGLVVFHDILEPDVRKIDNQRPTEVDIFWDALEKPGRTWEFVDYSDTTWGGIGAYEVPG